MCYLAMNFQKEIRTKYFQDTMFENWAYSNQKKRKPYDAGESPKESASVKKIQLSAKDESLEISCGAEMCLAPEIFFDPLILHFFKTAAQNISYEDFANSCPSYAIPPPLQNLIWDSVESSPIDHRKELLQNILLVGGSSLLSHFPNRLRNEIDECGEKLGKNYASRILYPMSEVETKNACWSGAAIGSEDEHKGFRISKAEWEENGFQAICRSGKLNIFKDFLSFA
eukprot:GHVP01009756.1.p1 GENE.GHVP01009756.1~~GHVP01009756.1.p1  ORF type:complete len:227 (+),score=40.75 GHVP01009756.1:2928-3608(+)